MFWCAGISIRSIYAALVRDNIELQWAAVTVAVAIFALWCETILFSPNEQMTVILFNDMTKRADLK